MSIRTGDAAGIKVVESHELLGKPVVVRSDVPTILGQSGITVSLAQVAENLVICPVFLDHVKDMIDSEIL